MQNLSLAVWFTELQSYKVKSNPEQSGGVTCHKRYNAHFASVNCVIPYQGTSQEPLGIDENAACFPGEVLRKWHSANTYTNTTMSVPPSSKNKRDDCGDPFENPPITVKVGDGNPHQNWYNMQVTVR